jgi:hypothetical protein
MSLSTQEWIKLYLPELNEAQQKMLLEYIEHREHNLRKAALDVVQELKPTNKGYELKPNNMVKVDAKLDTPTPSITNIDDEQNISIQLQELLCPKYDINDRDFIKMISLVTNKIKEAELRGRIKQLHDLRSAVLQAENPDDPTSLGVLTYVKLELKDLEAQL